jgi:hypothetical protein
MSSWSTISLTITKPKPVISFGSRTSPSILAVGGNTNYSAAMANAKHNIRHFAKPTVVVHNGGGTTQDEETSSSAQQGGYHT